MIVLIGAAVGFALMGSLICFDLWRTNPINKTKPQRSTSTFGVVWARYSTDKDGKQYFVDAQSGQVHSAHVAEFLKEIAEVQRKYDLDINAGADTLRVSSLSPEYGHSIFFAIDETGTKEDLEMRELIRCERRKALYEYHKGQK